MLRSYRAPLVLACLLWLACLLRPAALPAQERREPELRSGPWLTVRTGLAAYGTGDDTNCETLPASTAGIRVGTPTTWFVAVGADLYDTFENVGCTAVLPIVDYGDGVFGDEFAGVWLSNAPRLTAWLGYRRVVRRWDVEATVGAGAIRSSAQSWRPGEGERVQWRRFEGGALLVGPAGGWWAASIERGRHRIPVRHELYRRDGGAHEPIGTRRFDRWTSLIQIGINLRL